MIPALNVARLLACKTVIGVILPFRPSSSSHKTTGVVYVNHQRRRQNLCLVCQKYWKNKIASQNHIFDNLFSDEIWKLVADGNHLPLSEYSVMWLDPMDNDDRMRDERDF